MQYEDLLNLLAHGTLEEQKAFIQSCPDCHTKGIALQFLDFQMPNSNLAALDAMCNGYNGKLDHLDLSIILAQALHDIGIYQYQNGSERQDESLDYASNGAYFLVKFLFDGSRYEDAIKVADLVINFLQPPVRYRLERLCVVELYKTEALLMLNRFEEARQCFDLARDLDFLDASKIQRDNLQRKLSNIFNKATELRNPNQLEDEFKTGNQRALEAMEALLKSMGDGDSNPLLSGIMGELNELVQKKEVPKYPVSDQQAASYLANTNASRSMYDAFKSQFGPNDLHEIQQKVEQIGTIFFDPQRSHNPIALAQAIQEYKEVCRVVQEKNIPYELQTVWWAMSVCHNRLGQFREGLALTEKIWAEVEHQRSQIENYNERAGLLGKFEFLFTRLCDFYYQLNDTKGMLRAIESSKGRVLADALDRQQEPGQTAPAVSDFTAILEELPLMMQQTRANYLTFLLEDEYGFAVLVTSKGKSFHHRIDIGKTLLRQWLSNQWHNPQKWRSPTAGLFGKKQEADMTLMLAPLLSWLQPLIESGELTEGEHLCYCPDEDLNLFPFHYIKLDGKYLIERFTLSRIQGVYTLAQFLKLAPHTPNEFVSVMVCAQEDLEDAEKAAGFGIVTNYLKDIQAGIIVTDEDSSLEQLSRLPLAGNLVHFTTHGKFPTAEGENPYTHSGLLIFKDGNRPSLNDPDSDNLLTPERLLSEKINFAQAHITLQACVSGRSKEGIGGDALGLEWAFLLSGSSSLLASNWDVDYRYAAQFCMLFYQYWLQNGLTRAEAFQQATVSMMSSQLPGQYAAPYYWAGFTLMGDWR